MVSVHDQLGQAVSDAIVTFRWGEDGGEELSCITSRSGRCSSNSYPLDLDTVTSIQFTVTGVSHPAYPYSPEKNHDDDGDSDGTTITVFAPG
jgi:hypothetical protein